MKIIIIKKIIFLIFIGIIFLPKILLGENLDQAISKAKQHSLEIKIQKIQVNILQKDRDKIISEFFPAISANINIGQRNSYYEGQTYDRNSSQNINGLSKNNFIYNLNYDSYFVYF
jgi:outer membrane protein TolC